MMLRLTENELLILRSQVLSSWHEIPAEACLPGTATPLTADIRVAASWLNACISFLHSRSLAENVVVALDIPSDTTLE
jgi:hypothetical protein